MYLLVGCAVLALLGLHPFTTYPLSLLLLRLVRRPAALPQLPRRRALRVSICMCAYNEAAVIAAKAANLLALRGAGDDVQILVYVDGASDDTAEQLASFGDAITVVVGRERHGKTYGMRLLAGLATGDVIVFTDANVMIEVDALDRLQAYFRDPAVGCVCGHLEYRNAHASYTSFVNSAYWRLEEWIKQREAELGSAMGADGSLFAVRRALYPVVPDDIIDDFYVSMSILCDGHRLVCATDVRAYEHSVVDRGEEFRRKERIACQAFNVHRLLWPRIRRLPPLQLYCYVSHKFLRWFSGLSLGAAGALLAVYLAAVFGWRPAVAMVAAFSLAGAAALLAGLQFARKLHEIWLALLATLLGILRSLRGDRFQTWAPAQSIRAAVPGGEPLGELEPAVVLAPAANRRAVLQDAGR